MLTGKTLAGLIFVVVLAAMAPASGAVKDQSRIPLGPPSLPNNDKTTPNIPDELLKKGPDVPLQPKTPDENGTLPPEVFDLNNIPALERIDLTIDMAKRALDAFAEIGTKYDDQGLADYSTLEEYVAKTDAGKKLLAEVKKYGFKGVGEWNTAIMNVSFSFSGLLHDQKQDILHQIEAVKADKTLPDNKKKRIIASLNALIPTKENIDIIRQLMKLPVYQEKLNLLDAFE